MMAVQRQPAQALLSAGLLALREEVSMAEGPLIAVVDDDESVRESLPDLIRELGFAAQAFASAEAFLESDCLTKTRCLLLDVAMPGMSGPDLQDELARLGHGTPIVFITAPGGASVRPQLLVRGAVECLFKPFSDTELLAAIKMALGAP
jgi:FixJ family two-component response regulator